MMVWWLAQRGQGNFQASKDDNSFYLCYFTSKGMWLLTDESLNLEVASDL